MTVSNTFRNTDLAALELHQSIACQSSLLKQIYQSIPDTGEVRLQFVLITEPKKTRDPLSAYDELVYHAATAVMQRIDKTMRIVATIAKYEHGAYRHRLSIDPIDPIDSGDEERSVPSTQPSTEEEISIGRYPIIDSGIAPQLERQAGESGFTALRGVTIPVLQMFQNGVPLPVDERFQGCHITIMVRVPNPISRGYHLYEVLWAERDGSSEGFCERGLTTSNWRTRVEIFTGTETTKSGTERKEEWDALGRMATAVPEPLDASLPSHRSKAIPRGATLVYRHGFIGVVTAPPPPTRPVLERRPAVELVEDA